MTTILPILLALADFGHPFVVQVHHPDGRTIAVQIAVDNYSPVPSKSEFREWMDPRIVFLVESAKDTPSVLILRLYEARLIQIGLRFPRAVEEEATDVGR